MGAKLIQPIIIPELFNSLVEALKLRLPSIEYNNETVLLNTRFKHGTIKSLNADISMELQNPDKKDNRYPLIALIHNFTESYNDSVRSYTNVKCKLIIMNSSTAQKTYEERYEYNFKHILYNVWINLIAVMEDSHNFIFDKTKGIKFDKTDRPAMGSFGNDGNNAVQFSDYIDAIELDFDLTINNVICLKNLISANEIKILN